MVYKMVFACISAKRGIEASNETAAAAAAGQLEIREKDKRNEKERKKERKKSSFSYELFCILIEFHSFIRLGVIIAQQNIFNRKERTALR